MSDRPAGKAYDPSMGARNLVEVVREATTRENMPWLRDSDQPAVELAVKMAQAIEDAENPEKAAGWVGPQLLNVLKSLGMTPEARKALGQGNPMGTGSLGALRSADSGRAARRRSG